MAKYLREHKNKFEDHGNKATVKEIEIKTFQGLVMRYWNKEGGAGEFVYRGLKSNNAKLEYRKFSSWNN